MYKRSTQATGLLNINVQKIIQDKKEITSYTFVYKPTGENHFEKDGNVYPTDEILAMFPNIAEKVSVKGATIGVDYSS